MLLARILTAALIAGVATLDWFPNPGLVHTELLNAIVGGGIVPGDELPPKENCTADVGRTCKGEWNKLLKCNQNWCSASNVTGTVVCPPPASDCTETANLKSCKTGTHTCIRETQHDCGTITGGECHYNCVNDPNTCGAATPWNCAATACQAVGGDSVACIAFPSCTQQP